MEMKIIIISNNKRINEAILTPYILKSVLLITYDSPSCKRLSLGHLDKNTSIISCSAGTTRTTIFICGIWKDSAWICMELHGITWYGLYVITWYGLYGIAWYDLYVITWYDLYGIAWYDLYGIAWYDLYGIAWHGMDIS